MDLGDDFSSVCSVVAPEYALELLERHAPVAGVGGR
jgi:hypothetical protein